MTKNFLLYINAMLRIKLRDRISLAMVKCLNTEKDNDQLSHQLAQRLLMPSSARYRLTEGIYNTHDLNDPLGRLDDTLIKVIQAEDAEKKLHKLIKNKQIKLNGDTDKAVPSYMDLMIKAHQQNLINVRELRAIYEAHIARSDVIKVDDFNQELV